MDEDTFDSGVFEARFQFQTNEVDDNDIIIIEDNGYSEPELLFDETVIEALKEVASEISDHDNDDRDENSNGKIINAKKLHEH